MYRVYDITLASNLPLGDLLPSSSQAVDCVATLRSPAPQLESAEWFHHWQFEGDERPWCHLARGNQGGFLLRFPDLADFQVDFDPMRIECIPAPGIPHETIRHLLLDQVLPAALGQMGRCILHASGVIAPEGGVLALAGPTGTGKSTLAVQLCRQGCTLLTDDGLLLQEREGEIACIPSYPGIRLWDDSLSKFESVRSQHHFAHYTNKSRLALNASGINFQSNSGPLRRIYFLEAAEQVETEEQQPAQEAFVIRPLPPNEAFIRLVQCTFQINVHDRTNLKQLFERYQSLVRRRLFYRITYPHDWSRLEQFSQRLLDHFATGKAEETTALP